VTGEDTHSLLTFCALFALLPEGIALGASLRTILLLLHLKAEYKRLTSLELSYEKSH